MELWGDTEVGLIFQERQRRENWRQVHTERGSEKAAVGCNVGHSVGDTGVYLDGQSSGQNISRKGGQSHLIGKGEGGC